MKHVVDFNDGDLQYIAARVDKFLDILDRLSRFSIKLSILGMEILRIGEEKNEPTKDPEV